jgi:hypothetical protein
MSGAPGAARPVRGGRAAEQPARPLAGGASGIPAAVPDPPCASSEPSPVRGTATARGVLRRGATTLLRLPWSLFPSGFPCRGGTGFVNRCDGEQCAVWESSSLQEPGGVSHRVICPSLRTLKLPVAGCWR